MSSRIIIASLAGIDLVTAAITAAVQAGEDLGDHDIFLVEPDDIPDLYARPLMPMEIVYEPPAMIPRDLARNIPRYERQAPRPRDQYKLKSKGWKRS